MKPTILLMDSDTQTLEQLQGVLRRQQYPTIVAADGHAGLRLVEEQKPDLIVSDLLLLGLDGYKVWAKVRTNKDTAHIPILVVSALHIPPPTEPYRIVPGAEWQLLYYDALLPKPVDLGQFQRYVQKLLYPDENLATPTGSSVTIAIEDAHLRAELADILTAYNFGVQAPTTLPEAEKQIRLLPPAAVILDYRQATEPVKTLALQIKKFVPNTAILFIGSPENFDNDIYGVCAGVIHTPVQERYLDMLLSNILELENRRRRTTVLSNQLIETSHYLLESQQALQAQNDELQVVNEQLREIDTLKETFTGMIVHDLKSPLSAMLGAINFTLIDPKIGLVRRNKDMLNGAIGAGNQMLRLIETLLEGQRLRDGHAELDIEPFDIPDLVDDSLLRISPLLTLHRLTVEQVMPDDLPPIYADPYMSQRILENLLDNAIKFSPRDAVITIKATVVDEDFIAVAVQDEGPGIPEEQHSEIFQRFARVKHMDKDENRAGFGLGLTFCQQATEAMNGRIWVESDGKSGTTFSFTLPIYKGQFDNIEL